MIIVEGPDGSGKTTLIKDLSYRYGLPISPRVVGTDTEAMVDLVDWVEQNVSRGFQYTLFDRHRLISEPIYGPIMGRVSNQPFISTSWMNTIMGRFYECSPMFIYCLPPLETVMTNLEDDPDNIVVREKADLIFEAYNFKAHQHYYEMPHRVMIYDYTEDYHKATLSKTFDRFLSHVNIHPLRGN